MSVQVGCAVTLQQYCNIAFLTDIVQLQKVAR